MPSGSWVEAEVVVPVHGHLFQRMNQLHRDAPGAVLPVQGHREGSGLVQWRWPARLPSLGHPPSPLRSRDIQLLPAASRSTSVRHTALCDTISFQGVGVGAGVPIHTRV